MEHKTDNLTQQGGNTMARARSGTAPPSPSKSFMTPEAHETYLVSLAYALAEQRLRDGTASSQEVTHFLEIGSPTTRLKVEKLEEENKLLRAKTEQIKSQSGMEEMYSNAINAMRRYSGQGDPDEEY